MNISIMDKTYSTFHTPLRFFPIVTAVGARLIIARALAGRAKVLTQLLILVATFELELELGLGLELELELGFELGMQVGGFSGFLFGADCSVTAIVG
jgi:hypothetical protein